LIQEQRPRRNIDSRIRSSRFDYCAPVACRRVLQHIHPESGHAIALSAI
jgi:hypothetical protein